MVAGESLKDIPPLSEGGPSAAELLPAEITSQTEMGRFAATVLSLVERQTGVPIDAGSDLVDISEVPPEGLHGDINSLIAISDDGHWIIRGHKDVSRGGGSRTLKDVPMINIEVGHVVDVLHGNVILDQKLEVEYLGEPGGEERGTVKYTKDKRDSEGRAVSRDVELVAGDSRFVSQGDNQARIVLEGSHPDMKREKGGFLDRLKRKKPVDEGKEIPGIVGHVIDSLPSKERFSLAGGRSTIEAVVDRRHVTK